ncbi:hypothetical protein ACFL52_04665, partial [Candidatus Margulisiibacteriota bacterium]
IQLYQLQKRVRSLSNAKGNQIGKTVIALKNQYAVLIKQVSQNAAGLLKGETTGHDLSAQFNNARALEGKLFEEGIKNKARSYLKLVQSIRGGVKRGCITNNEWNKSIKLVKELSSKNNLNPAEEKQLGKGILTLRRLIVLQRAENLLGGVSKAEKSQFKALAQLQDFRDSYLGDSDAFSVKYSSPKSIDRLERQLMPLATAANFVSKFRNGKFFNLVYPQLGFKKQINQALAPLHLAPS